MLLEDYIQVPLDKLTQLMVFEGEVIKNKSELARVTGASRSSIYRWVKDNEREKLEDIGVEYVYAASVGKNYYICTDGEVRLKSSLRVVKRTGRAHNLIRLSINGKIFTFGLANLVYRKFVDQAHRIVDDGDAQREKVLFVDGDLTNCRLDNLDIYTPKK